MVTKAFHAASLVLGLRFKRSPKSVVNHVLSNEIIKPSQVPSELHRLAGIVAGLRPENVLEIGTFKGGTLCILSRLASPLANIISVDLPGGKFGGGYNRARSVFYRSFAKYSQRMTLIRGDSHSQEIFSRVRAITPQLDFLFIDGDHTYEGVKQDFTLYSQLVRPGGIVALHDVAEHPASTGCEVRRFWQEIKPQFRHTEIIENERQGWAGIGVLYL